jgi:hypothetical protein
MRRYCVVEWTDHLSAPIFFFTTLNLILERNFMKLRTFMSAFAFVTAFSSAFVPTLALADGKHDHSPKHGGIVVETKHMDYEIVAKPDSLQIYLRDHDKPVKVVGLKAKITLLNGTEKTEVELSPAGDKLEAKGAFKVVKGTKGIAAVTHSAKSITTVRFEIK